MRLIVILLGCLLGGLGAVGVLRPSSVMAFASAFWASRTSLYVAVLLRITVGWVLLQTAAGSQLPGLLYTLGVVSVLSGLSLPIVGFERIARLIEWWKGRSPQLIRVWCLVVLGLGAALVYAVL